MNRPVGGGENMKILLLNPYFSFDHTAYVFYRATIPYQLLYLSSYLKKHGIESKIYELGVFDEKDCIKSEDRIRCGISDYAINAILEKEQPDIVGISTSYTVFHQDYIDIIKLVNKLNPFIRIIVGGNHASVFPELMLEAGADQVVVGEGEEAFLDIVRGNRESIVHKEFIQNLDDIPFPDYGSIDLKQYIDVGNPFTMRSPSIGIITSRGCPHNCIYCTANGVWQRKWRARSPENVIAEIKWLNETYGIGEFHILDDNVSVNRVRLMKICDLIIEENLDIKWATPNGIAHWTLDYKLLNRMKEAGCYRITLGIESGDRETRKFIGKPHSLAQAEWIITWANRIGMWTMATNIIGFPYETREQISTTIQFAKDCGVDFATFFLLLPHPSSEVFKYFVKEGLFKSEDAMSALNEGGCATLYFTKTQLNEFRVRAYKEFVGHKFKRYLLHPSILLRKIRNWEDLLYVIRVIKLGFGIKSRTGKAIKTSKDLIFARRQYV